MLVLGFTAFLGFGVVLVLVGANQADLARALSLDLARSGLLVSALSLGIGAGVVAAGPLFDRRPRRPLFVASTGLTGAALLLFQPGIGFPLALALLFATGLGAGAYDTLINAAVVERYRERSARPMSVVHAAATLGAMLGPPLVGWIAAEHHFARSFHAVGLFHLGLAACGLFVCFGRPEPPHPGAPQRPASAGAWLPLLPVAAVAFAYVGVESGMTIFALPYASAAALPDERGRLAISAFWCGLLVCRLAVALLRRIPEASVLLICGAAGAAVLGAGSVLGAARVELWFGLAGLALGPVYPLMIALAGQRFPGARGTAAGLAAGAGALGGFALPWLTGAVGDGLGIATALGSLALWCLAAAVAAALARRI